MDYAILGFLLLLFIFELVILWYQYWTFNELNKNCNDINEMIQDIYRIEAAEAAKNNIDVVIRIPKRSREMYAKNHKQECTD